MRCSYLLLFALLLFPVMGGVTQPRMTARFTNQTLDEVLQEIKRQSGVYFMYNTLHVNGKSKVTAELRDVALEDALEIVLRGLPYTFQKESDYVLVLPRTSAQQPATVVASGVVTDERGDGLPGVTIRVKGSTVGTTTDAKGSFRLAVPREGATLIFSFVGMENQEIKVEGVNEGDTPARISVRLKEDLQQLEEVVVTGLFTRKRESFTGSAPTFTREDLKRINNGNLLSILGHLDPAFVVAENLDAGSDPNRLP
ncbi:MAG: carboxypeptidase-like regulatory domain-containing protein, partial [Odoribacteraceae bacterium]|nr:carboxypeptidase-like regulatory domain-containing protein [Odoribacteraceae bacterium]